MSALDRASILSRLQQIHVPLNGADVLTAGLVNDLRVEEGNIYVTLLANSLPLDQINRLRDEIGGSLGSLPGVNKVRVIMTAHPLSTKKANTSSQSRRHKPIASAINQIKHPPIPDVKMTIAVASGKGGVGKSTIAANLAVAMAQFDLSIGLLDADIYGPSLPTILGINELPKTDHGMIIPIETFGIRSMSIGYLTKPEQAIIWRGPMVMGAIGQLLTDVHWGYLDVLIIDLPPGTGDVQLTLVKKIRLDGAIIVSTPQELSLSDVRRSITMFEKTNVPILGIIENMSCFHCPNCGYRAEPFGEHGKIREKTGKTHIPLLGKIPLSLEIGESAERGIPFVSSNFDNSPARQAYRDLAHRIFQFVNG